MRTRARECPGVCVILNEPTALRRRHAAHGRLGISWGGYCAAIPDFNGVFKMFKLSFSSRGGAPTLGHLSGSWPVLLWHSRRADSIPGSQPKRLFAALQAHLPMCGQPKETLVVQPVKPKAAGAGEWTEEQLNAYLHGQ